MSGKVVKLTARDRTLSMWDNEVSVEAEEITLGRQSGEYNHDAALEKWHSDAQNEIQDGLLSRVSVVRFKNGKRGIAFVRFKEGQEQTPHFSSQLLLQPNEYYTLAQAIFRESSIIRELIERHPEGTDPTVDKIRDFCTIK